MCGPVGDHHAVFDWVSLFVGIVLTARQGRHALLVENLLLRQQLAVALRSHRHPNVRWHDRLFWVVARRLVTDWRRHLLLVQPETVLRWHRRGWRRCWWWRSRRPMGRPRLSPEMRDLLRRLSEEHLRWGTESLRGELLTLDIAVGNGSIGRSRWHPAPRPPSQTWGHQPTYLIRDRDRVYGGAFAARAKAIGVETLLTPFRAPKANAIAERVVRTLRNECLDHVLILNERHLRSVLAEYVAYY